MNRKTLLLLFLFVALWPRLNAQDIIVLRNGTTILSKVLKIGTTEVEYKKFSNLEGPLYTVEKHTILAINFENGEKETFSDTLAPAAKPTEAEEPQEVKVPAASNNALLIAKYNERAEPAKETGEKSSIAKTLLYQYGITNSSILSNEDIEISFALIDGKDLRVHNCCDYIINITNKTNRTIYVDLGNSFRVNSVGESYVYFDTTKQTTVSKGGSGGASMNAGAIAGAFGVGGVAGTLASGLTMGGGKQTSTSTTYTNQRVITIAPKGTRPLSAHLEAKISSRKAEAYSHGEEFCYPAGIKRGIVKTGERKFYTENDTPATITYTITYSKEEEFGTYSSISFALFLQQIVGYLSTHRYAKTVTMNGAKLPHYMFADKIRTIFKNYSRFQIVSIGGLDE